MSDGNSGEQCAKPGKFAPIANGPNDCASAAAVCASPEKPTWVSNFCRVLTCGGCEPRPSSDSMRFSLQPSSTALAICARCLPGFGGTFRSSVSAHTSDHVNYSCCLIQPSQIGLNPLPAKSSNILRFQAHRKREKRLQVIHTAYIMLRAGISSSTLALCQAMIPQIIKTHC